MSEPSDNCKPCWHWCETCRNEMNEALGRIEDCLSALRAGDLDLLRDCLHKMRLAIVPIAQDALVYNAAGDYLLHNGMAAEAVAEFRKALVADPNHAQALGNLYYSMHMVYDDARKLSLEARRWDLRQSVIKFS